MEISGNFASGELRVNSHVVNAPCQIGEYIEIENVVVIQLATDVDYTNEERDFELEDPKRNIVAIDESAEVVWIVSDPPRRSNSADTNFYYYIFSLLGNLYARDIDNRIYMINPKDGTVTQSFDEGILPIGDMAVSVDGRISKVIEFDDKILVSAGNLYGFDTDGTELWRDEERRGMIYKDGEILLEKRQRGPRTKEMYRLDPDTGKRLAEVEAESTYWGWKYVRDISDMD